MQGFIFGKGTDIPSPDALAKRRALLNAMQARNASVMPKNLWEGLNNATDSITGALQSRQLDSTEAEAKAGADAAYAPVIEAIKNKGKVGNDALVGAMGNEWLSDPQQGVVSALLKQNMEADAPLTKWQQAQLAKDDQITPYQREYLDYLKSKGLDGGGVKRGLNPQYGVDANGNPVIIQLGDDGTSVQTPLPEGVSLSKTPIKLDAGTHFVLLDPITRQPVGSIPKDLAGAEAAKAVGEAEGKAIAAAPGDLQAGENATALIDSIRNDPNKGLGTGFTSMGNIIPGTPGKDFQNKVDQAKSGAFLTSIQQMRGLGQLSNTEGQAATAAINRLSTATSEAEFDAALNDYETIVKQGMERAKKRVPDGGQKRLKFNPDTGDLE